MAVATGQLARQFCRLRVWKVQQTGLLAGTRLSSTAAESRTKVLYDGDCPICQKEMAIVKYLNKKKGTLDLIDINKADFNPSEYGNFSQKELTDVFHVVDSNKQVYKGLHAMHKMYSDVGFGWTTTYLLWPGLHPIFNRMYMWFAKNRLRWTNRAGHKANLKA